MQVITIQLDRLTPGGEVNVRQHGQKHGIKELAGSIKARGLIHPLVVRHMPDSPGKFEVIDGNRRFAALKHLHGKKNPEITVIVQESADLDAREVSLMANVMREQLHPVDEYEAYQALISDGVSIDDICARFGAKQQWVKQRLQLASLAPEIRAEWRAGKLNADQAAALSSVPDHARQVEVWGKASKEKGYNASYAQSPETLRRAMRSAGVQQVDGRVKFVGIDAYIADGGRLSEDLFDDTRLLLDESVLDAVVSGRLADVKASLLADGWGWVAADSELEEPAWRLPVLDVTPWLTDEERAELTGKKQVAWNRRQELQSLATERALADPDARAKSGVVIEINAKGEIELNKLRMRESEAYVALDEADQDEDDHHDHDGAEPRSDDANPSGAGAAPAPLKLSAPVVERLSEVLTLALSEVLARDTRAALIVLLASVRTAMRSYGDTPLQITARPWSGLAPERHHDRGAAKWISEVASLSDGNTDLHKLLASETALLLDLREDRNGTRRLDNRASVADVLAHLLDAGAVNEAIASKFDPAEYFEKVPAALIADACAEMGVPVPTGKKAEKAASAAAFARDCGWLPLPLRTRHYTGPGSATGIKEAAE